MQPVSPPPVGKTAFRQGLNFGLLQALIAAIILLTNTFINTSTGVGFLLATLNFLLSLAAYFVAGILAAKQTGRLNAGTFAGMWTGAIYGAINLVISLVIFFAVTFPRVMDAFSNTSTYLANPDAFRTGAMIGGVFADVFGALLAVGFGAGLGVLGGLIGRKNSRFQPAPVGPSYFVPPPTYQPAPYVPVPPAQPAPDQPTPEQPAPAEQIAPSASPEAEQFGSQPYMEQSQ